jgi:hypothetical protein
MNRSPAQRRRKREKKRLDKEEMVQMTGQNHDADPTHMPHFHQHHVHQIILHRLRASTLDGKRSFLQYWLVLG